MASIRIVPWKPGFREFFTKAGEDWTPPATVRSAVNDKRDRMTLVGRFRMSDGTLVKLTSRCRREADGWYLVAEELDIRLSFGSAQ